MPDAQLARSAASAARDLGARLARDGQVAHRADAAVPLDRPHRVERALAGGPGRAVGDRDPVGAQLGEARSPCPAA